MPPRGTSQWLRQAGIRPRKAWGQNFLVNPRVASRLVRAWALEPSAHVLEIGAGAGSLTLPLLEQGARIVAVERDPALCELLAQRARAECPRGKLRILTGDILDVDPTEIAPSCPARDRWWLVGNLPYAITTPILEWAARYRRTFEWSSFMVQREYGDRLLSRPGSAAYGALTVWLRFRFDVRKEMAVGAANFWPRPKVESVVLRLVPHAQPPVEVPSEGALERVVRAAFGQRRKVIGGALAHGLGVPRQRVEGALAAAGIGARRRAEECDLAEFAALARALAAEATSGAGPRGDRMREPPRRDTIARV